jgi:ferredoxin--NADP+ reductase
MSDSLNHKDKLTIAVVGSGPSGFYATEALLKNFPNTSVNIIEKLPVPFGLVRFGVAPDHPKLKQVIMVYNRIAENPNVNFFGNVELDKDITIEELQRTHHAVILCYGARSDRDLNIPGTSLKGYHSAREFVAWYNGDPEAQHHKFDFSHKNAVIIGQGNVAADVCRILTKSVDELKKTDITTQAIEQLSESKIRNIHIIGRRGPAQAKFSSKEIRELGELSNCSNFIEQQSYVIDDIDKNQLSAPAFADIAKCVSIFKDFGYKKDSKKQHSIEYKFLLSPIKICGDSKIESITFMRNRLTDNRKAEPTGDTITIDCGLCFSSIGYRGQAINNIPFDDVKGTIINDKGRVINKQGTVITGLYTSGWIKRGPSGIIGTNRADSVETIETLVKDIETLKQKTIEENAFINILKAKKCRYISYEDWKKIDDIEIKNGSIIGKSREKITDIDKMLSIANK